MLDVEAAGLEGLPAEMAFTCSCLQTMWAVSICVLQEDKVGSVLGGP